MKDFPKAEFDQRWARAQALMEKENLDAFVVNFPANDPPKQLDRQLKDGSLISLHIEAKTLPESSVSVWLVYLTRWGDLKK